jgi:6-pyruvoyl-tetrahydropterin synthase
MERSLRDQEVKESVLQEMDHTHIIVPYSEIISPTEKENIKKVTIALLNENLSEPLSEAQIFLLKEKLQKAYDAYNKVISKHKHDEPFLKRDGEILLTNKQLRVNMNSIRQI